MQLPFFLNKKNKRGLIGVDFQPHGVAVAHILHPEKSGNKAFLKQCAFQPYESDDSEARLSALKSLLASFPTQNFYCNASASGFVYELLLIDAPKVESGELKQAVRWRIKEQLPYHIDDAVIDVFEIPDQPTNRQQLMYVVSALQSDVDASVQLLKQAGLDIYSIDIYELLQRNIAAIIPEDKDGLVMLKFHQKGGLLTITRNGTLYLTRNIDFNIDRLELAIEQSVLDQESEIDLSLGDIEDSLITPPDYPDPNFHDSESDNQEQQAADMPGVLSTRSRVMVDELILEIQRSLDYYVSHFNQRPAGKIVFAPITLDMTEVIAYIHEMLGIKTEVMDFNHYLDIKATLDTALQEQCFNAIGLALRQVDL